MAARRATYMDRTKLPTKSVTQAAELNAPSDQYPMPMLPPLRSSFLRTDAIVLKLGIRCS